MRNTLALQAGKTLWRDVDITEFHETCLAWNLSFSEPNVVATSLKTRHSNPVRVEFSSFVSNASHVAFLGATLLLISWIHSFGWMRYHLRKFSHPPCPHLNILYRQSKSFLVSLFFRPWNMTWKGCTKAYSVSGLCFCGRWWLRWLFTLMEN